jgi:hypothetical protein
MNTLENLLQQASKLSPEERLWLAGRLIEGIRPGLRQARSSSRHWAQLKGRLAYPAAGMDAQDWVRQMREESDHQRQVSPKPSDAG